MGVVQKDVLYTSIISYFGLILGYLNRGIFFIWFLTTNQIGLINLVVAVGLLFAQFSNLGVINAILKFFPFFKNQKTNNYGFILFIFRITLFGILLFSTLFFFLKDEISSFYISKSPEFVEYYFWVIPIGIANLFFYIFDSFLKSLYKNLIPILVNEVFYRLLILVALLSLGYNILTFQQFIIVYFCLYFFTPISLFLYLKSIDQFKLSRILIKRKFKKIIIKYSILNYSNTLGTTLVTSIDTIMIASILGLSETGIYTTIIFLISALSIINRSMARVAAPYIAEYWRKNELVKMNTLYKQFSSVSLLFGIILFMIIWINRIELFSLFPTDYLKGIPVFLFLMIGKLIDFYGGVNGIIFLTSKRYSYDIFFTVALLFIVYILNYFLIPIYGISGAAISTGIALAVYNVGRIIFIKLFYNLNPFESNQIKVLILFILNLLIFETIFHFQSYWWLTIILRTVLFFLLFLVPIYLLKIEPNSISYFNQIFEKIKRRYRK